MGCMSWYGGCISASSISVMPADQISACQKKHINYISISRPLPVQETEPASGFDLNPQGIQ